MADWVTEETKNKRYSDIPGLKPWLIRALKSLNILRPTPVQFACVPPALQGRDVIGGAKTGSGKTMAFVLPVLDQLSVDPYGIYALVLTPTRELAFQIADQFRAVGASLSLRVSVVVGGQNRLVQCQELQSSPHVVVATPGRLYDLLNLKREFTFEKIKFLILDEADRLLDGRFSEQLSVVLGALPAKRQTLLFSATITQQIKEMEQLASSQVFKWESAQQSDSSSAGPSTVAQLREYYCLVNPKVRDSALVAYLLQWREASPGELAILFVDTCAMVEALGLTLLELGIQCVTLHSNKSQRERLAALTKFKSSQCKLLVATDLASRGLDIPLVSLVVNHRLPNDHKTYIHRVGRTARAGRPGVALTLITPEDQNLLLALEAHNPQKLIQYKVDDVLVRRIMKQVNVTRREQEIKLEDSGFAERRIINKRKELILQGLDPDEECARLQERIRLGQEKRRRQFLKEHCPGDGAGEEGSPGMSARAQERLILQKRRQLEEKAFKKLTVAADGGKALNKPSTSAEAGKALIRSLGKDSANGQAQQKKLDKRSSLGGAQKKRGVQSGKVFKKNKKGSKGNKKVTKRKLC